MDRTQTSPRSRDRPQSQRSSYSFGDFRIDSESRTLILVESHREFRLSGPAPRWHQGFELDLYAYFESSTGTLLWKWHGGARMLQRSMPTLTTIYVCIVRRIAALFCQEAVQLKSSSVRHKRGILSPLDDSSAEKNNKSVLIDIIPLILQIEGS